MFSRFREFFARKRAIPLPPGRRVIVSEDVAVQDPFGGFTDTWGYAPTGPHLLVSGPTGSGKSRRVLSPATMAWSGPVVNISSKPDMFDMCAEFRRDMEGGGNPTYVMDFAGSVPDDKVPDGVQKLFLDPCRLCQSDDDAMDLAVSMIRSSGDSDPSGDRSFWESLAIAPLAALIRAAGADGIRWVMDAKANTGFHRGDNRDSVDLGDVVEELMITGIVDYRRGEPSWAQAYLRLRVMGSDVLAKGLADSLTRTPGQISSAQLYLDSAVNPWKKPSSLPGENSVIFTPSLLHDKNATLFIIASAEGVSTGAVIQCLDRVLDRWRENQLDDVRLPRLLMVIDEMCNTAPWPRLPSVVTEARGIGVCVLGAVQSSEQFVRRFGAGALGELRGVWPAILCLAGADEMWLWRDAMESNTIREKAGQVVNPVTPPSTEFNEGVLFYRSAPKGAVSVKDYVSGSPVVFEDVSNVRIDRPCVIQKKFNFAELHPEHERFVEPLFSDDNIMMLDWDELYKCLKTIGDDTADRPWRDVLTVWLQDIEEFVDEEFVDEEFVDEEFLKKVDEPSETIEDIGRVLKDDGLIPVEFRLCSDSAFMKYEETGDDELDNLVESAKKRER